MHGQGRSSRHNGSGLDIREHSAHYGKAINANVVVKALILSGDQHFQIERIDIMYSGMDTVVIPFGHSAIQHITLGIKQYR